MDSVYTKFFVGKSKYNNNFRRSGSVPLFNLGNEAGRLPSCLTYNSNNNDKPFVTSDVLKIQMMEDRLKNLEKKKQEQNDQINALMSYQMNQNRLNKSNSSTMMIPVNQQPNALLLTANNVLQPLNYMNNLNRYYDMQNLTANGIYDNNRGSYKTSKTDNDLYRKHKKLYKNYKKDINEIKSYLDNDKIDEKINKNLKNKIYLPIKHDINNMMDEINYNLQKKMENDNNVINSNINAVERNYDEIKYLLQNKIDKMELKQKIDFENLKNELQNSVINRERQEKILNNNLLNMKMRELEDKRNNEEKEELFQSEINEHINEEVRKQRELDEMKHQKELDELRRKHEIEDLENQKMVEELKFQKMRDGLIKNKYKVHRQTPQTVVQPMVQPMIQQMPYPLLYPMPNNNGGNDNKTSDELFKLFMMKSLFGNDLFPSNKKKKIRYKYYYNNVDNFRNPQCINCPYHHNGNRQDYYYRTPHGKNSISVSNISSSELYSKHHKKHKKSKRSSVSGSESKTRTSHTRRDKRKKSSTKTKSSKQSKKGKKDKKKSKKKGKSEDEEEEEEEEDEDEEDEEGEEEEDEEEDDKKKGKKKGKKKKDDDEDDDENDEDEEGEDGEDGEGEDDEDGNEGEEEEDGEGDGEEDDEEEK